MTGAASGFGAEIARVFAREGAKVAIFDLNGPGAEAVAAEIGGARSGAAVAVAGDVTSRADVDRALDAAAELGGGRFDIIVNNAGWTHRNKPLLEVTEDEFDRVYAINVKSIYHMVSAAVPRLKGRGGVLINVGSTAGIRPRPGLTWYNSTKGAVNLLTRSLAVELAPERIRVNCIAPVMGATGLLESFMGVPDTPENRARFIATIPLGRLSEPKDIANAALFLASDEAEFVTGVILEVDGGRTI